MSGRFGFPGRNAVLWAGAAAIAMVLLNLFFLYLAEIGTFLALSPLIVLPVWISFVVPFGISLPALLKNGWRNVFAICLCILLFLWLGMVGGLVHRQALASVFRNPPPRPMFQGDFGLYGRNSLPQWWPIGIAQNTGMNLYLDDADNALLLLHPSQNLWTREMAMDSVTLRSTNGTKITISRSMDTLTLPTNEELHTFGLKKDAVKSSAFFDEDLPEEWGPELVQELIQTNDVPEFKRLLKKLERKRTP